ncbi:MAG: Crp/Fnr family transcriptional regulator [Trebonia sp.]|jgi:CRP-like cAMP-binding protein
MTTSELARILRATDLFASVPSEDLEAVAAASRLRVFRRGQIVCAAGQPGDTVMVVVSGRLRVVVRSADGGELTLTVVQPGGVVGELAAVDGGPRSADAETLEECRLLLIPGGMVRDICARVPAASLALARSLAVTLRRLTEGASDLVFLDLPRRVAKVLLSQPRDEDGVILLRMSQQQLAHQAAGTRQSINATLRGFERRGWVEVHDRTVTVKQAAALSRFAGD